MVEQISPSCLTSRAASVVLEPKGEMFSPTPELHALLREAQAASALKSYLHRISERAWETSLSRASALGRPIFENLETKR
jgi:hypothetical protein